MMRKQRSLLAFSLSADYERLGTSRAEAMQRFAELAPELGVTSAMTSSPCAEEAMDRLVRAMAATLTANPHAVTLRDLSAAMLPGLMHSATLGLLAENLVTATPFSLIRKMGSLCQLHRRELAMARVLCEARDQLTASHMPYLRIVGEGDCPHPAFLKSASATSAFGRFA